MEPANQGYRFTSSQRRQLIRAIVSPQRCGTSKSELWSHISAVEAANQSYGLTSAQWRQPIGAGVQRQQWWQCCWLSSGRTTAQYGLSTIRISPTTRHPDIGECQKTNSVERDDKNILQRAPKSDAYESEIQLQQNRQCQDAS